MAENGRCPKNMDLLLPWYVMGTLSPREKEEMEVHLKECSFCMKELERVRAEMEFVGEIEESVKVPWAFDGLERELESEGWWERLKEKVAARPGLFLWGFVLQGAAVLALVFVLLFHGGGGDQGKYVTLSASGSKGVLVIVFDGSIKERDMRKVLLGVGASIVSGPSPQGAYRLGFSKVLSPGALEKLMDRLRATPGVKFVARCDKS